MIRHAIALIALGLLFLPGCKKPPQIQTRVQAFSTGWSPLNDNSTLVQTYGGHAIRIDDGSAVVRLHRISGGVKVMESEQVLDSSKHDMAWITPRVTGKDVEIEFGRAEQDGTSDRMGTIAKVLFQAPHRVGSGSMYATRQISDDPQELLIYWVVKEAGTDIHPGDDSSEAAMLETSKAKPVDFLWVTVARK